MPTYVGTILFSVSLQFCIDVHRQVNNIAVILMPDTSR